MTENREITGKLLATAFMACVALAAVAVLVVIGSLGALFGATFDFAARSREKRRPRIRRGGRSKLAPSHGAPANLAPAVNPFNAQSQAS